LISPSFSYGFLFCLEGNFFERKLFADQNVLVVVLCPFCFVAKFPDINIESVSIRFPSSHYERRRVRKVTGHKSWVETLNGNELKSSRTFIENLDDDDGAIMLDIPGILPLSLSIGLTTIGVHYEHSQAIMTLSNQPTPFE
jgi:hypothetical protein